VDNLLTGNYSQGQAEYIVNRFLAGINWKHGKWWGCWFARKYTNSRAVLLRLN